MTVSCVSFRMCLSVNSSHFVRNFSHHSVLNNDTEVFWNIINIFNHLNFKIVFMTLTYLLFCKGKRGSNVTFWSVDK